MHDYYSKFCFGPDDMKRVAAQTGLTIGRKPVVYKHQNETQRVTERGERALMNTRCLLVVLAVVLVASSFATPAEAAEPDGLLQLIEHAGLDPWRFSKHPKLSDFEYPDARNVKRSLARDYQGKVVLLFMFAEW